MLMSLQYRKGLAFSKNLAAFSQIKSYSGRKIGYTSPKKNIFKYNMNAGESLDPEYEKEKARKEEIERLKAAEKFMEIDEGKFECQACGYVYEPKKGDRFAGIEPGTPFPNLPSDFYCPACRSPKTQFRSIKKIIAGFAVNQQYGLGGNSLTGSQKNSLIFGVLGVAFLLLLSGYLLE